MRLSRGLNVFWVLHFQNSPQNIPYCNTTKTYLRGELFDKGGGVILYYVPYGIQALISGLLLAQEVFSVDIEPFSILQMLKAFSLGTCWGTALYTFLNNLLT